MHVCPALLIGSWERFHSSSVEQRFSMNRPLTRGPCPCPRFLPHLSPPHALGSRHTAFPDPETHQALSHLRAFAPAEPSAWNTSPTSDLGTSVTSSGRPSLTLQVTSRCSLFFSNVATRRRRSLKISSLSRAVFVYMFISVPSSARAGIGLPCSQLCPPHQPQCWPQQLLSDYLSDE